MDFANTALPTFDQMLGTLDHLLAKAAADPRGDALMTARLAADMHPLATQIRFSTAQVVNTLNRLAGASAVSQDSDHGSIADARGHVAHIRALVAATPADAFVAEDSAVAFDLPNGMAFRMTAAEYLRDWSLPQFYFHVTTA